MLDQGLLVRKIDHLTEYLAGSTLDGLGEAELTQLLFLLPAHPKVRKLRGSAARKLMSDISWAITTPLSEVFMRATALRAFDKNLLTGKILAQLTKKLLSSEYQLGGPYSPSKNDAPRALDNALVALFLQEEEIELPAVNKFLVQWLSAPQQARQNKSTYLTLYVLAKLKNDNIQKQLIAVLSNLKLKTAHTSDKAFFIAATQQLGKPALSVEMLNNYMAQNANAHFKKSELLLSAAWLNVLSAHVSQMPAPLDNFNENLRLAELVYKKVELSGLGAEVREQAEEILRSVQGADGSYEIALIAHKFLGSLATALPKNTYQMAIKLGVANIYCWMAYIIYDDFFDDEGKPIYLPAANTAMRRSLYAYTQAFKAKRFHELIYSSYDIMDSANTWELINCRATITSARIEISSFPNYGNLGVLSQRAFGHVIGVMGLAMLGGASVKQLEHIKIGLNHFLIARQLNDDIHDWLQDLRRGHLTYVVTTLLQKNNIRPGIHELDEIIKNLQTYFWNRGHQDFSKEISWHIKKARAAFKKSGLLNASSEFMDLIQSVENAALQGLAVQKDQELFLKTYQKNS